MPPLEGIRVLDLSRVLAGPYCTMLLADLGADVIKVERPGEGDETRTWGPPYVGGESAYFLSINRGKRSVALDLARPEAQEALARLARDAHVVVENFRPGVADRLGAGYERLARENPELVYCSITGFGDERPGYDFVVEAESGLMAVTGEADGPPLKVGVAVVDVLAGYAAATGVLAALVAGRGERIEISLYDVALSALVNVSGSALVTGEEPGRHGNAHPSIVPYETFAAADGPITRRGRERRALPPALRGDRAARPGRGRALPDELRAGSSTARSSSASSTASSPRGRPTSGSSGSRGRGVPVGKVRGVLEALEHGRTLTVDHPTIGTLPLVASPLGPRAETRPPPLLGEHTREVLGRARLRRRGDRGAAATVERVTDGVARQHYNVTFTLLAVAAVAYALLQSLVAPALLTIQHDLDTTTAGAAWILTAYLLSASVVTPIAGRLGDMYGKKRTMVVVLIVLAFGTLLAALATSIGVMIVARVIQGAGGAVFPLSFAIIRDEFPPRRVPHGIALISAILGIGGGLGIVLAGPIVQHLDYHWLFWFPLGRGDRRDDRDRRLRAGVAGQDPWSDRLARGGAARRLADRPARPGQPGHELGLDVGAHARPVRDRGRADPGLGLGRVAHPLTARGHADDAAAAGVDDQPGRARARLRHVRLVRARAPSSSSCRPRPASASARRSPRRGSSWFPPRSGCSSPGRSRDGSRAPSDRACR